MSIHEYNEDSIITLSAQDHIRMHPGLYVRSQYTLACDRQLFKEVFDNAIDESRDLTKKYYLKVLYFTKGDRYQFVIIDYGRGIPIGKMSDIFTLLNTSGKFLRSYGGDTSGVYGVGSKTTAALSRDFVAMSKRQDGFGYFRMHAGDQGHFTRQDKLDDYTETDGTTIFYETDHSILTKSHTFHSDPDGFEELKNMIDFITIFKRNTVVELYHFPDTLISSEEFMTDDPVQQRRFWSKLQTLEGKLNYVNSLDYTPEDMVYDKGKLAGTQVWELAQKRISDKADPNDIFGYDIHLFLMENYKKYNYIIGSVNFVPIREGKASHIKATVLALKYFLAPLIEDQDIRKFFESIYRLPISGYIFTTFAFASFVGQTKDSIENSDFEAMLMKELIAHWKKKEESHWMYLLDALMPDIMAKYTSNEDRMFGVCKNRKGLMLHRPNRFLDCASTDPELTELFIMEGDSAGATFKMVRDGETQAAFYLTGKPPNVDGGAESMDDDLFEDLCAVIGVRLGQKKIDTLHWARICLLADADAHGYHINALIYYIFLHLNPQIITDGRLLATNPPLYSIPRGKGKFALEYPVYLRDKYALDDLRIEEIYRRTIDIAVVHDDTGSCCTLQGKDFSAICKTIIQVGGILEAAAKHLALDHTLFERLVYCRQYLDRNIDTRILSQILGVRVEHDVITHSLVLSTYDEDIFIPLSNLMGVIRSVLPDILPLHLDKLGFIVNSKYPGDDGKLYYQNTPMMLSEIYNLFTTLNGFFKNMKYLKGIGECTTEELRDTCINPTTRTVTRITSIGDIDRIHSILSKEDTTARKALVLSTLKKHGLQPRGVR